MPFTQQEALELIGDADYAISVFVLRLLESSRDLAEFSVFLRYHIATLENPENPVELTVPQLEKFLNIIDKFIGELEENVNEPE